ncbi:MAG: hypothetical protein QOE70_2896 [Chthoniobacter sp.]|nr:hypothetical protein [Chthoniobacter sp.]
MLRKGPPKSVFGFGSQLSSWLMPPSSQTKSTCFSRWRSASANPGEASPHSAPSVVPRKARRESECSRGVQRECGMRSVVREEFRRAEERPREVADGFRWIGAMLLQPGCEGGLFVRVGPAGQDR